MSDFHKVCDSFLQFLIVCIAHAVLFLGGTFQVGFILARLFFKQGRCLRHAVALHIAGYVAHCLHFTQQAEQSVHAFFLALSIKTDAGFLCGLLQHFAEFRNTHTAIRTGSKQKVQALHITLLIASHALHTLQYGITDGFVVTHQTYTATDQLSGKLFRSMRFQIVQYIQGIRTSGQFLLQLLVLIAWLIHLTLGLGSLLCGLTTDNSLVGLFLRRTGCNAFYTLPEVQLSLCFHLLQLFTGQQLSCGNSLVRQILATFHFLTDSLNLRRLFSHLLFKRCTLAADALHRTFQAKCFYQISAYVLRLAVFIVRHTSLLVSFRIFRKSVDWLLHFFGNAGSFFGFTGFSRFTFCLALQLFLFTLISLVRFGVRLKDRQPFSLLTHFLQFIIGDA